MGMQVCLIYLFCDFEMFEFCVIEGLKFEVVYQICLCLGEGLVGCVVWFGWYVNIVNVLVEFGFCYMVEMGEEVYFSFLGVLIQCVGEKLGVLVVQLCDVCQFFEDEVYGFEVVVMVLVEMVELGVFFGM